MKNILLIDFFYLIKNFLPSFDRDSTSSPKRCINEPIVRLSNSGLSRPPPNKRKSSTK